MPYNHNILGSKKIKVFVRHFPSTLTKLSTPMRSVTRLLRAKYLVKLWPLQELARLILYKLVINIGYMGHWARKLVKVKVTIFLFSMRVACHFLNITEIKARISTLSHWP